MSTDNKIPKYIIPEDEHICYVDGDDDIQVMYNNKKYNNSDMELRNNMIRIMQWIDKIDTDGCSEDDRKLIAEIAAKIDAAAASSQEIARIKEGVGYLDQRLLEIEKENGNSDESFGVLRAVN